MGTSSVEKDSKLVYAMRVDEVLPFDRYYTDPRFQVKKPIAAGNRRQRCGDNIYYRDSHMIWH